MDTSTQTPTVLATPQGATVAQTPPVTPPAGAPVPMDPITSAILGALSLGTSNSEYNLTKSIAGNATKGTNNALQMLQTFLSDPSSITKMPGYQFGMDQGLDAVNRGAGASGMLNSGNRLAALQQQGQAYAGTWMDRIWGELMGNVQGNVAGGQLDLGAGNLMLRGLQDRNTAIMGGAGGILQGIGGLLTQGSPLWNALIKAIGGGGGGPTDVTNVPNNTVPPGFNPGNSDVPPATDWTPGSDLPTGGDGLWNPTPIDWSSGFDPGFIFGGP